MTTSPAPLTIRLFGAPEVEAHGRPLILSNQKARALLFYLAATAQPHTRSHLATLLWSESPTNSGRRSLRVTLFQLRQALQAVDLGQVIMPEGDLLRLQPVTIACDVIDFCRLVAEGSRPALVQALDLYRGPFLEGFSLPNTDLFDEWVRLEDEKLTQAHLGLLRRLAGEAEAQGDVDEALAYLQRLVQADPLAEEAQRQLIRLYLQTGATGQAMRQYHYFESELHEKLGLTPAPETQALFQQGLRQAPSLSAQTPAGTTSNRPPQASLPFVGRDHLLNTLLDISQEVKGGRGGTVLLQGDGGIGKTRLLLEFLARLGSQSPPWLALQGACSPFDDLLSYGPFLEAFQESPLGDLTDLLLAPNTDAPAARDQFVQRILQTLRRLSRNAPLALAIDDLQWANSSTLNLFGLLATRLHHLPLLLIGAAQRPEAIPALQRLITVERRRGQLRLLALPPLTEAAVTDLLQGLAISPTAIPPLVKWLQERADGNPFVLDEMLAQLQSDAILTRIGDQWHLDPGRWLRWRAAYTLPETTHDLVSWRLRNLSPEAYALLELLAVAGRPAGRSLAFDVLAEFPGFSAASLLSLIDDLLNRRLLVETGDGMFALAHDLLRETILHRLSHVRRRLIHRQLAHLLAKQQQNHPLTPSPPHRVTWSPGHPVTLPPSPPWEVARHAVAGEDVELARRYGLPILSQLPQDYTGAETVDFLHHLYDLLAPSAVPDEMLRLARVIADVHQALGHLAQASYWQQQYLDLARQVGDAAAQAIAHLEKGELALVSNDYLAATEAAEAGLAACASLPQDDPAFSYLTGRGRRLLGHALAMEGSDLPAAERHLQEARDRLRAQGLRAQGLRAQDARQQPAESLRDLCASLFELGNVAAQRGQLLRALEFYQEAAQVAEAGQVHYFHALAHNNYAYHSLLLGRPEAARQALAQGQWLAEAHELLGAYLHLASTQGEIHLYLGEWEAARQACQRGLKLAEELGNPERQAGYRAGLALAARGQGDLDGAIALLQEALLLISGRGYWHLRTRLLIWLAETLLLDGQTAVAGPHVEAALATAQAHGRALLRLQAGRLQAHLLAAGDWPAAEACFTNMVELAGELDLPLEIARTQAAWGQAAVRYAPSPHQGHTLLTQARHQLTAHQAAAELAIQ